MGILRDLLDKLRAKKARMADAETDVDIQRKIQEKQLTSDERELMHYQKQEHDKAVHAAVEHFRKQKNDEFWYGSQGWKDKRNIFKGQQSIITGRKPKGGKRK